MCVLSKPAYLAALRVAAASAAEPAFAVESPLVFIYYYYYYYYSMAHACEQLAQGWCLKAQQSAVEPVTFGVASPTSPNHY